MKKLHIKFTVTPSMLQSYCNTSEIFYNNNNGRALPTLPDAAVALKAHAERINTLADIATNVNATEIFYREKLQDSKPEELVNTIGKALTDIVAGALKVEAKHIKATAYTKTKLALSFAMGTITIQITRA